MIFVVAMSGGRWYGGGAGHVCVVTDVLMCMWMCVLKTGGGPQVPAGEDAARQGAPLCHRPLIAHKPILLHINSLNDVALMFLSLPSPYLPFENRRGKSWRSVASSRHWRPLPGTAPRRGPSPRTPACRGKARRRRSRAGGGRAIHPCGRMPRRQGRGRGVVCRRRRAKLLDRSPESPSCPHRMPGEWLYVVAMSEGRGQEEGQGGVGREIWVV